MPQKKTNTNGGLTEKGGKPKRVGKHGPKARQETLYLREESLQQGLLKKIT